jgi:hypothetical protein
VIDNEKLQALRGETRVGEGSTLASMSPYEVEALREALDLVSPHKAMSLADLNLEHELMLQFSRVKTLQQEILTDDEVPVNQRAQVANAVASTLQQLIKMQSEFSTAERFKAIEALMIKAMKKLPLEVAEEFLKEYGALDV